MVSTLDSESSDTSSNWWNLPFETCKIVFKQTILLQTLYNVYISSRIIHTSDEIPIAFSTKYKYKSGLKWADSRSWALQHFRQYMGQKAPFHILRPDQQTC